MYLMASIQCSQALVLPVISSFTPSIAPNTDRFLNPPAIIRTVNPSAAQEKYRWDFAKDAPAHPESFPFDYKFDQSKEW